MKQTHPLLPKGLSTEDLADWLKANAVENFIDTFKHFFTQEEVKQFEHDAVQNSMEIERLMAIKTTVMSLLTKGAEIEIGITIPPTIGTKELLSQNKRYYNIMENGYETVEMEIFAIPSNETMEYFDLEGNHQPDRKRPLTKAEKAMYNGIFAEPIVLTPLKMDIPSSEQKEVVKSPDLAPHKENPAWEEEL